MSSEARQPKDKAIIAGVGMIPFLRPGQSESYDAMGAAAVRLALADAGLEYGAVQQAVVGYVYGDSTSGQAALYRVGMTGVPVINVNNNCATGSTALYLARQAIEHGVADCVLALGFEQMTPGALGVSFPDRVNPLARFEDIAERSSSELDVPMALRIFGGAGKVHMDKYGTTLADFAKVRAKASRHGARNPLAIFRSEVSDEDVLASPTYWPGVLTRLMACPPTCGAAAAILVSRKFARQNGVDSRVEIAAQAMVTDAPSTFEKGDMLQVAGYGLSRAAAAKVYESAGAGPEDIDVVELHDCFAQNELISYEALGLCGEGEAQKFIADENNSYGGQFVTNPSGGLLSKGHPLGATGLAQCYELTRQLRGQAEDRQVEGARFGLQHNLGLGGACVVSLYQAA